MCYQNVNVYYAVVRNVPVLAYLVSIKIKVQQACVQQYVYVFTKVYQIIVFMAYALMKRKIWSMFSTDISSVTPDKVYT